MSNRLPPQPWTYTGASAEELIDGNGDTIAYVYVDSLAEAIQGIPELIAALESARHALTTLHGLTATDLPHEYDEAVADGCDGHGARDSQLEVSWVIDESKALAEIDAALLVVASEVTNTEMIEIPT